MKFYVFYILTAMVFTSCVPKPYYGSSVIKEDNQLVCGLHKTPVKAHKGYLFNGLVTFENQESMNFGTKRFPTTLVATFSEEKDDEHSLPFTDYSCSQCEEGYNRLEKMLMWYKNIVGWSAKHRRQNQLEKAAKKAERTGNTNDAKVRDGDGYLSIID